MGATRDLGRALEFPQLGARRSSGAETIRALSWLIAAVEARTAPWRVASRTRRASRSPRSRGWIRRSVTEARTLIDVGNGSSFPSAAHLAAYAGLATATRSSGSPIRGEHPLDEEKSSSSGLSSSRRSPPCRTPRPGPATTRRLPRASTTLKTLLCLARRRADVLFTMLRNGTFYEPQPVRAVVWQT